MRRLVRVVRLRLAAARCTVDAALLGSHSALREELVVRADTLAPVVHNHTAERKSHARHRHLRSLGSLGSLGCLRSLGLARHAHRLKLQVLEGIGLVKPILL